MMLNGSRNIVAFMIALAAIGIASWARSILKTTNAAGSTTKSVDMVYFRRDLSRVTLVKRGQGLKKWGADLLPPKRDRIIPAWPRAGPRWILDPIW